MEATRRLQAWRLCAVGAIAWLVHDASTNVDEPRQARLQALSAMRRAVPAATEFAWRGTALLARSAGGRLLATGLRTQPAAAEVVGYSGVTDVLLVFTAADGRIVHGEVLRSGDTTDHVAAVVNDDVFLPGYLGLSASEAGSRQVDAVSGATLTSCAVVESIALRLGEARPSLRFPEPVTLTEVLEELPEATAVEDDPKRPQSGRVYRDGLVVAGFVCTGPRAESVIGYQGPSDVLLLFDLENRLQRAVLRGTYDNQPYVRHVATDRAFWRQLEGRSRAGLAALDPDRLDGVSGATMTSAAVARGVTAALRPATAREPGASLSRLWRSCGSAVVVLLLSLGALAGGHRWTVWRWGARLLAIGWLGLIAGDLLSQALLIGWLRGAVPWQTAPGLVVLAAAALILPAATGRPVYCQHMCPHGAVQLLLSRVTPRRWQYRGSLRSLAWVPVLLLVVLLLAALDALPIEPAWLEAFDGWLPMAAAALPIAIMAGSLLLAPLVPMGYCRVGCPTGLVLGFVRRPGPKARWSRVDAGALALLALAVGYWLG